MTSFSQWYNSFVKEPVVKPTSWVYGVETILVQDVVDRLTKASGVKPWNFVRFDADTDSERLIFNTLLDMPLGLGETRLSVVHNAQKLNSDRILEYLAERRYLPANRVVFVSAETDIEKVKDDKENYVLPKHIDQIRLKGALIQCRSFTQATAKYAVSWVQESANISSQNAAHLLNRANGDLRLARDVITKLKVFDGEVSPSVINAMLAEQPKDTFLTALFALDRKTALVALKDLPKSEWSRTLGLIDARLELAGYVHDAQIDHKTTGEIARGAGNKSFLVPDMLGVAKYYDKKRRQKIRDLLATIDEYTDTGIPNGALEALIAFW